MVFYPLNKVKQQENSLLNQKYVPGEIVLGFTDDVPYLDTVKAIESENLTYKILFDRGFEPSSIVAVSPGQAEMIADRLKQNKLIYDAIPRLSRNEIEVRFVFGTRISEAQNAVNQESLKLKSFFRFAYIIVYTPIDKEKFYIDKFKKLSIIKSAELNGLSRLY